MRFSFMSRPVCLATAAMLLVGAASTAQAEKLRSPWDGYRDSQWDSHKPAPAEADYSCPVAPPFAKTLEIGSYYIDSHASVADPQKLADFQKASEASSHLSQYAALAADAYLAKGNRSAAACVYSLLDAAARADAWDGKMPGFQGVYIQNWLLSAVAISYLKVRDSGAVTPEQDADIHRWFEQLAVRVTDYFDAEVERVGRDKENNHMYWVGLSVAAAGIANNNPKDFAWGVMAYRMGIDAIQPDGTLTAEMNRAQMALHYHLYALGPLIVLAELGEANGLDLYAEDKGAIHRLVNFCLSGLEDPSMLEKRTGVKQIVTLPYGGSDIGWAVPYVRRFPNPQLSTLIAKAPWVRYTTWGGAPPD